MDSDRKRWDERWAAAPDSVAATPPDVISAHPELLDVIPAAGRALDIACGPGAQALWLAERGLAVTALDVSSVAIDRLTPRRPTTRPTDSELMFGTLTRDCRQHSTILR